MLKAILHHIGRKVGHYHKTLGQGGGPGDGGESDKLSRCTTLALDFGPCFAKKVKNTRENRMLTNLLGTHPPEMTINCYFLTRYSTPTRLAVLCGTVADLIAHN